MDWILNPILPPDTEFAQRAKARQTQLTKPPGALGRLEKLAVLFAAMQKAEFPVLDIDRLDTLSLVGWEGGNLGSAVQITNAEGATVALNADGSWTIDASSADALGAAMPAAGATEGAIWIGLSKSF